MATVMLLPEFLTRIGKGQNGVFIAPDGSIQSYTLDWVELLPHELEERGQELQRLQASVPPLSLDDEAFAKALEYLSQPGPKYEIHFQPLDTTTAANLAQMHRKLITYRKA